MFASYVLMTCSHTVIQHAGIKKGKAEPPKQAAGFSFGFQAGAETNGEADESGEQEEAEASEDDADPMPAHNGHPKDSAISVDVPERYVLSGQA